jgi:DNA-binding protein HU-beta
LTHANRRVSIAQPERRALFDGGGGILNKSELVEAVASKADVDKRSAERVLGAYFDTVQSAAKGGDRISWPGFGSFRSVQRSARMGRTSPTDATPKRIPASTGIKFTPSTSLKEFMNTRGRATATKAAPKKAASRSTAKKATKATKKKATKR